MIDVVIVNWNSGELLGRCLTSVDRNHHGTIKRVVVVDNGSDDSSAVDALTFKSHSFQIHSIRNTTNEGFAAACNKGAKACSSELILFLNPDCEMFPETLESMLLEMASLPVAQYGVFGIRLIGADGTTARGCNRQPVAADYWVKLLGIDRLSAGRIRSHIMTEWPHTESRDVEHVIGAFYLVVREVFEKLSGFDERFFVYLEDLDLSRRVLNAGYRIRYLADTTAFHQGGGSSRNIKAERLFYSLRSRVLFGFKHFSPMTSWALVAGTMVVEPLVRLTFAIARGRLKELKQTIHGFALLWRDSPNFLPFRGRKRMVAKNIGDTGHPRQM